MELLSTLWKILLTAAPIAIPLVALLLFYEFWRKRRIASLLAASGLQVTDRHVPSAPGTGIFFDERQNRAGVVSYSFLGSPRLRTFACDDVAAVEVDDGGTETMEKSGPSTAKVAGSALLFGAPGAFLAQAGHERRQRRRKIGRIDLRLQLTDGSSFRINIFRSDDPVTLYEFRKQLERAEALRDFLTRRLLVNVTAPQDRPLSEDPPAPR